jgi:MFS family permease
VGHGLAVLLLAISAFVIVTTEFIIVGLLPGLSRDLGISISTAGQLVTLFAFTVMLAGPFLTAMLSHFERKRLFVVILLVFAGANALAAAAPNIWVPSLPVRRRPARRSPTSISAFPARWCSAFRSARWPRPRSGGAEPSGACRACRC